MIIFQIYFQAGTLEFVMDVVDFVVLKPVLQVHYNYLGLHTCGGNVVKVLFLLPSILESNYGVLWDLFGTR